MRDYSFYSHEPAGMRKMRIIESWLETKAKEIGKTELRILDVGCGNGHLTAFMASRGHKVIGIDESADAIAQAKEKYVGPEFLQLDSLDSFKEKFDIISAFEVCEHIPPLHDFLESAHNHLADNGSFLMSVPNGWSIEEMLRHFMQHTTVGNALKKQLRATGMLPKSNNQSHADSPHVRFWQYGQWKAAFEVSEFVLAKSANVSFVFKQMFYIGLRRFLRPTSSIFQLLDRVDNRLVSLLPRPLADGWLMLWNKKHSD